MLTRMGKLLVVSLAFVLLNPLPGWAHQAGAPAWTEVARQEVAVDGVPVALSPNGQWIAGIGPERQQFCVWAIPDLAETCHESAIVPMAESIAWAPDSSAVAYGADSARFFDESDIMVFDIATMTLNNMTDDPNEEQSPSMTGQGITLMDVYPAWAPDSASLVFVRSEFGGDRVGTEIMRLDVASGEVESYFKIPGEQWLTIYSPMFFEPDGSLLVSIQPADVHSGQAGIWRIGPGGKGISRVLAGGSDAEIVYPQMTAISADGSRVALFAMGSLREFSKSPYGILDLTTGDMLPMPGSDVDLLETHVYGYISFAGDTTEPLYLVRTAEDSVSDLVAGRDDVRVLAERVPVGRPYRGLDWSDNNIVMVPGSRGEATLITLALTDARSQTGY